jgi:Cu/Ag efflux protein CusF
MHTTAKIAACAAALALTLACRDAAPARAVPAKRYAVRGEVTSVGAGTLSIRHEAIPDFADRSGAVTGMSPMVMPFPVAEGVSLAGLAPGAKIRFTFVMDWERNRMEIERLEPLPADTALRFDAR